MTKPKTKDALASPLRLVGNKPASTASTARRRSPLDAVDQKALINDIRVGVLSWAEMGRRYGVSEAAVRQWAKRNEVQRGDLADAVRDATRAMVSGAVDAQTIDTASSEPVVAAAVANLAVVMRHRADLQRLREIQEKGLDRLEEFVAEGKRFEGVADAGRFCSAFESAARTARHIIEKERQAHAISDDIDPTDDGVVNVIIKKYSEL